MDTTVLAKQHINIISGKIVVLDPPSFEEAYRIEREFYHSNQIAEAKAKLPSATLTDSAKLKGKIASARRQQTTFFGKKPFVNLKGLKIKKPNSVIEEIVTESSAVQKGLTDYWRPIYSVKTAASSQLEKLLSIFSRQVGPLLTFDL